VSEASFTVRFDGPIFEGAHKMAVEDFAPSVLALSEMFKRANVLLNGERTSVRVLIDVDVEQHCLQVGLQIVQSIWEHARDLLGEEHIKSAAHIAVAIGVLSGGVEKIAGAAEKVVGLIGALKRLRGKAPDETKMVVKDGRNVVQITAGRDVIFVAPEAHRLLIDPGMVENAKKTIEPAGKPGYDKIEFEEADGTKETIDNEEARLIQDMPVPKRPDETVIPPSRMRARVGIRRAVYMGTGKWTIQHEKAREMTIADEEWLKNFQNDEISVPPGSFLDVTIGVSEIRIDSRGEPTEPPEYTILKVHEVILP
jgi:hypothetical protein